MELEQITQIIDAAQVYMTEKGMTQADLAKHCQVPESYLSNMLNGKTAVKSGDKDVVIGARYWMQLAAAVGVRMKKIYWEDVETTQWMQINHELELVKVSHTVKTMVGVVGSGKTYGVNLFKEKHPKHTYILTINNLVTVLDLLNELCRKLDVPVAKSKAQRMYNVVVKLRKIYQEGGYPIIIFDEAENMSNMLMKTIKGLFDGLYGRTALVLVGTPDLIKKLLAWKASGKEGAKQFCSRFLPGARYLTDVDKRNFKLFFDQFNVPSGLRKLLSEICDDYRELNIYLEAAMREADSRGVQLTAHFFRLMFNMPE